MNTPFDFMNTPYLYMNAAFLKTSVVAFLKINVVLKYKNVSAFCERDSSGTTEAAERREGDGADSPTRASEAREAARPKKAYKCSFYFSFFILFFKNSFYICKLNNAKFPT